MEQKKYKGVYPNNRNNGRVQERFIASHTHKGVGWIVHKDTEIEAARAYDMRLISLGLEPVNILKRKIN